MRAARFMRDREPHLVELMDDPECDSATLRRTYAGFRLLNPIVATWHRTYRRLIRPLLSATDERTLLDVGCGGGDITRSLARWAARDKLLMRVTGIDPEPRALAYARSLPPVEGATFRQSWLHELDESFDFVVSNHVLHHLDDVGGFLRLSGERARVMSVHSDLARSRVAYAAFGVLSAPFFPGSFIRADGLTSLRRSFTAAELRKVVPSGWRVIPTFPSRLLAVGVSGGAGASDEGGGADA